jgi:hypothetical protein
MNEVPHDEAMPQNSVTEPGRHHESTRAPGAAPNDEAAARDRVKSAAPARLSPHCGERDREIARRRPRAMPRRPGTSQNGADT